MTLGNLSSEAEKTLAASVGQREAKAMLRVIFEHYKSYTPVDLAMRRDEEVTPWLQSTVEKAVERVVAGEPLQYVLGVARFMGNDYKVSPAVLIPRPETQGLVDMVTDFCGDRPDLKVLDACTGSGCIAVALAKALRFAEVDAYDISGEALEIARENAKALHADVNFFEGDALSMRPEPGTKYNVIVANPPYILRSEAKEMDARVLEHEPESALFVPDESPLIFYTAIAGFASGALLPGGRLFFEINPLEAKPLKSALEKEGFNVDLCRDYVGKTRFAVCSKTCTE